MADNRVVDKDLGWAAWFDSMKEIRTSYVKVGVLDDGQTYEDGLTVAEIAAVHEFGTEDGRIPERSFVRATFDLESAALTKLAEKLFQRVVFGKMSTTDALNVLGAQLAADIKRRIQQGIDPPNAMRTALAKVMKGKTRRLFKRPAQNLGEALAQAGALAAVKPLIDTGRLLNAVTWAVEAGE